MDRDPAFFLLVIDHGLVHIPAIHAFTTIVGKQGGVDIDDPVRVGPDKGWRNLPEKSGQYDQVNAFFLQFRHIGIALEEGLFF